MVSSLRGRTQSRRPCPLHRYPTSASPPSQTRSPDSGAELQLQFHQPHGTVTHKANQRVSSCLQRSFLSAGVQLEVVNADGGDDVAFTPGITGAVGEDDLVVALTPPQ